MISGDQEFSVPKHLTTVLPAAPCLDWAAASQHCGLIECNIQFLEEKFCLLCHSLPFMTVPGIIVAHMVLHLNLLMDSLARVVSSTFLLVKS
jgi:hypothetical protein